MWGFGAFSCIAVAPSKNLTLTPRQEMVFLHFSPVSCKAAGCVLLQISHAPSRKLPRRRSRDPRFHHLLPRLHRYISSPWCPREPKMFVLHHTPNQGRIYVQRGALWSVQKQELTGLSGGPWVCLLLSGVHGPPDGPGSSPTKAACGILLQWSKDRLCKFCACIEKSNLFTWRHTKRRVCRVISVFILCR